MLRTRIILVTVTAALIALLFFLPKVVVENDKAIASAPADSILEEVDMHARVSPETQTAIKNLRAMLTGGLQNEKNAIFADSLADLYAGAGQFDSAAWFAEETANLVGTPASWIKAGDYYYQAFSFALDQAKQTQFAARAQAFYNKILAVNPADLEVKSKLAMTYLGDPNPMLAIGMLREVLDQDPKNQLALYNMGMLSIQSGQHEKAVGRLTQLIEINPNHTQGKLLLGIAYLNTGERQKAKEQFEQVKLLDQDPSVQATVDSYLKDLK